MSEGKRAASVWAQFGVDTSAAVDGLARLAKATEKTLKQVEAAGNKLGGIGLAIGASIAAAVRVASKHNPEMAAATKAIEDSFSRLGNSIGMLFLPVVEKISAKVKELSQWFDSLDPQLKQQAADWAVLAAGVLVGVGVIGKLAGGLASIISLATTLAPILATITLPAVAGVAALVVGSAYLYKAWKTNWHGMRDTAKSVLNSIGPWFTSLINGVEAGIVKVINLWRQLRSEEDREKLRAKILQAQAIADNKTAGWGQAQSVLRDKSFGEGADWRDNLRKSIAAWQKELEETKTVPFQWKEVGDGLKAVGDDVVDTLGDFGAAVGRAAKSAAEWAGLGKGGKVAPPAYLNSLAPEKEGKKGPIRSGALLEGFISASAANAERIAKKTEKAADNLAKVPDYIATEMRRTDFGGTVGRTIMAKMGQLGSMVGNVVSAAKDGGPWAAVIAAFMEFFAMMESWQEKQEAVMETLEAIAGVIELVMAPLNEVLTFITQAITDVLTAFIGIFDPGKAEKMRKKQDERRAKSEASSIDRNTKAVADNTAALLGNINTPSGIAFGQSRTGVVIVINGGVQMNNTGFQDIVDEGDIEGVLRDGSRYGKPGSDW
jgi:hypothetical protein